MIRLPAVDRSARFTCRCTPSRGRAKLSGARKSVNFAGALLLVLAAGACIAPGRRIPAAPSGDWTVRLGDARHAPYVDERVPTRVRVEWDEGMGRGLPAAPVLQDALIISVISGGGVVTASADDGTRYWGRRFNGSVAGQVLRVDTRVLFVTQHRNSTAYALDLLSGRRLWSRRLNARAVAEPAWADGYMYVVTDRGELVAIDSGTGEIAWRACAGTQPLQPPVLAGDEILIAARDTIVRLARSDGATRGRHAIAGAPTAPLALHGDTLTIAMQGGVVATYAERGARELWRHQLGVTVLAAPVVTSAGVYVLTRDADLYRLTRYRTQRIAELDGAATESLTITADGALIGRLDGRIAFVGFDGTQHWEERLSGSIRAPAAVRNASVYVGTLSGRMVKLSPS
jgi:outer membrane protein assembly factor BamB